MNVAFYEPWRLVNRLHRDLDRLMGAPVAAGDDETAAVASWIPAIDIREEEKQFVLHADLPGVDPANIEVWGGKGGGAIPRRRE